MSSCVFSGTRISFRLHWRCLLIRLNGKDNFLSSRLTGGTVFEIELTCSTKQQLEEPLHAASEAGCVSAGWWMSTQNTRITARPNWWHTLQCALLADRRLVPAVASKPGQHTHIINNLQKRESCTDVCVSKSVITYNTVKHSKIRDTYLCVCLHPDDELVSSMGGRGGFDLSLSRRGLPMNLIS